jgi:hypothetical protein
LINVAKRQRQGLEAVAVAALRGDGDMRTLSARRDRTDERIADRVAGDAGPELVDDTDLLGR